MYVYDEVTMHLDKPLAICMMWFSLPADTVNNASSQNLALRAHGAHLAPALALVVAVVAPGGAHLRVGGGVSDAR